MMTWPLIWASQWHLHFPFSGSVAQDIDPDVNWFFAGIRPQAGNKEIERKAFDIASYGRQLGLITEVLLDMAATNPPHTLQGQQSLQRLQAIQAQIASLKGADREALVLEFVTLLRDLHSQPKQLELQTD
mgnify:CR=1 FL=1